ncbi:hypothetical protein RSAG8_04082, partial [Rhizoctonia solani AG-8 WAC10335]
MIYPYLVRSGGSDREYLCCCVNVSKLFWFGCRCVLRLECCERLTAVGDAPVVRLANHPGSYRLPR